MKQTEPRSREDREEDQIRYVAFKESEEIAAVSCRLAQFRVCVCVCVIISRADVSVESVHNLGHHQC